MAPDPSRVVLAPKLLHTLVHDGPPHGREERKKDAAGVAHRELFKCRAQAGTGWIGTRDDGRGEGVDFFGQVRAKGAGGWAATMRTLLLQVASRLEKRTTIWYPVCLYEVHRKASRPSRQRERNDREAFKVYRSCPRKTNTQPASISCQKLVSTV